MDSGNDFVICEEEIALYLYNIEKRLDQNPSVFSAIPIMFS
jgi:hypothetical protein